MQALNSGGLVLNALAFGMVVLSISWHSGHVILALVTAIPYAIMGLVHFYLCRFSSQRIAAFLASIVVCAIGVWISIFYLRIPAGETSPGMALGYFLIVIYGGPVALLALVICAVIQRAHSFQSKPRPLPHTPTAEKGENVV